MYTVRTSNDSTPNTRTCQVAIPAGFAPFAQRGQTITLTGKEQRTYA